MVRRFTAAFVASCGLVAAQGAIAQEKPAAKAPTPDVNTLFQQLDADSDGQVAENEVGEDRIRLFKRLLRKADKDGDGKLSRAEFVAGLQEERPQPPADGPNPQGNERRRQFLEADPEELFKRLDANGDGKVELEETPEQAREGLKRFFEQADANRDQSLSLDEFRKGHEYVRTLAGANTPPNAQNRGAAPGDAALFKALDADGDGTLSAEELAAATAALKKLDRDGDGQITRREIMADVAGGRPEARPGAGNPEQVLERLKRLDKNGDGKLAQDELPPFLQNRFDKLDANADGFVDQEELKRAAEAIREQIRKQGGPVRPRKAEENKS